MKNLKRNINVVLGLLSYILLFTGNGVNALSYDYTATVECLAKPYQALYNGGLIKNPELNRGIKGWSKYGHAKIQQRELHGNKFIVAHSRINVYDSISQKLYLHKNMLYSFSAWIQVSEGEVPVIAAFKTRNGYKYAGAIVAESNCWSMLKGGLTVDASGPAELYFESNNTNVDIWVDSVSLQPFTHEQWKSHQDQSIELARKAKVRMQAVDKQGNPLPNATVLIEQSRLSFPVGCAINRNILSNTAYQNWFTSRFTVTTFENEMKWYFTEGSGWGQVDYSVPDAMLKFANKHGISVRGHNVLWDDPQYQPYWIRSLSASDLWKAIKLRIGSVMSKYRGKLIAWDVVNENLHFSFFEDKLGKDVSAVFYRMAHSVDARTTLFMNEYNTIEDSRDSATIPAKYLRKLRSIQAANSHGLRIGIGLESHFEVLNIPYMRASIDTLAATGLPLWLTEVDVKPSPNQAQYLEQVLREAHSHPRIGGIVIWSAWSPSGCYRMCLTDNNFKNLATGDVVDNLLREWGRWNPSVGTTDADGFFEASLFHGEYDVQMSHPTSSDTTLSRKIQVSSKLGSDQLLLLQH